MLYQLNGKVSTEHPNILGLANLKTIRQQYEYLFIQFNSVLLVFKVKLQQMSSEGVVSDCWLPGSRPIMIISALTQVKLLIGEQMRMACMAKPLLSVTFTSCRQVVDA